MSIFEYLLLVEKEQRDASVSLVDSSRVFEGRGIIGRFFHCIESLDFKAFAFIVADFLPYIFLMILLLQFAYYAKYSSSDRFYLLYKHGLYFFIISLVYFITVNSLNLYVGYIDMFTNNYFFSSYYTVNYKTQFIKLVLLVTWGLIVLNAKTAAVFSTFGKIVDSEIMVLSFAGLATALTLVSVNDLWLVIIVLDGFGVLLYISVLASRTTGAVSGASQYFIFGALGSGLIAWGASTLFGFSRVLSISAGKSAQIHLSDQMQGFESLGFFSIIICGLLIKFGAAPLYYGVIQLYSSVSYYWLMFFSIYVKLIIAILIAKLIGFNGVPFITDGISIISMIVGTIGALRQVEIKKFFAYSSVVHVGFLLAGDLTAYGIYLLTYIISSYTFFSVLSRIKNLGKELMYMSELRLIGGHSQVGQFLALAALLSMAGLPPFAGFFGKYVIFQSLIEDVLVLNDIATYSILMTAVCTTIITAYYYLRLVVWLFTSEDSRVVGAFFNTTNRECISTVEFIVYGALIIGAVFYINYISPLIGSLGDLYV